MGREWRQDPVRGTWVIVAPDRAGRPDDFRAAGPSESRARSCRFCEGREGETTREVLARRSGGGADSPGWTVRVIPNKYPALGPEPGPDPAFGDCFVGRAGLGLHEVVIESPRHDVTLTDLQEPEVAEVLRVYRDRLRSLREDARLAYALIFKNVGAQGGASVEHLHSQLMALPFVPDSVRAELDRSVAYRRDRGTCLRCDLIVSEGAAGRSILETERFAAYAPFASRLPFETHLVPRAHASRFEEAGDSDLADLAHCLRETIRRIETVVPHPAYNYLLRTAPLNEEPVDAYHWSLEVFPRLTRLAGFEWGTGIHINTVAPEEAARRLREA